MLLQVVPLGAHIATQPACVNHHVRGDGGRLELANLMNAAHSANIYISMVAC
jgi:hypothetical protein